MALERVEATSERTPIEPLLLYREDLMRACEILSQLGPVEVEVNGKFKVTDTTGWEELASVSRDPITSMKITTTDPESHTSPEITVNLNRATGNDVHVSNVTHEARGIVSVLRNELHEHRRFNPPFWARILASYAVSIPGGSLIGAWLHLAGATPLITLMGTLVFVSIVGSLSILLLTTKSKFLNVTYAEAPKFRERLLDDQGVALFWTLIGVALGGVMGYLVNQIPPLSS